MDSQSNMIQNKLKQAQQLEIQIEQLMNQKYQLDLRVKELERTLKELSEVKEDSPVYKAVGPLLYKVDDRKKLVDELEEQKELSSVRIKTLEKNQKALEDKYKELEAVLKKTYQDSKGSS
ncbi:MAG: prefoldin subunit beta [Candidatus Thermoplasmatota archaeon]|nr:prefoldin subunit beta [Candidatus Thermoplasmatota archaeon]